MRFLSVVMAFFSLFSREIDKNAPDEIGGDILNQVALIANKKYPLHACGTIMAMPDGEVRKLGLCFTTKDVLSRDQLRALLIDLGSLLIQQINSNAPIQRFLIKRPFTMKEARIIIYNRDKRGFEVYDPLIASAQIGGGILTFRTTDSKATRSTKEEFDEPYEEALEILKTQRNQVKENPTNSRQRK